MSTAMVSAGGASKCSSGVSAMLCVSEAARSGTKPSTSLDDAGSAIDQYARTADSAGSISRNGSDRCASRTANDAATAPTASFTARLKHRFVASSVAEK
jgi:hypothetical protein